MAYSTKVGLPIAVVGNSQLIWRMFMNVGDKDAVKEIARETSSWN